MQDTKIQVEQPEILKFIGKVITELDFRKKQGDFFKEHQDKFKDGEKLENENDHEYHALYKKYTNMLDEVLDQRLEKEFSQEEIQEFLQEFEKTYQNYEDCEIVSALFSFVDYEKWKSIMIEYKDRTSRIYIQEEEAKEFLKDKNMERNVKLCQQYYEKPLEELDEIIKGTEGEYDFSMYEKHIEGTPVIAIKSIINLKDISVEALVNCIMKEDYEKMKKDNPSIKEINVLDQGDNFKYVHYVMEMEGQPKMDMVTNLYFQSQENGVTRIGSNTCTHEKAPEQEGVNRISASSNFWVKQIGNDVNLTSVSLFAMKKLDGTDKMLLRTKMAASSKQGLDAFYAKAMIQQEKLNKEKEENQNNL